MQSTYKKNQNLHFYRDQTLITAFTESTLTKNTLNSVVSYKKHSSRQNDTLSPNPSGGTTKHLTWLIPPTGEGLTHIADVDFVGAIFKSRSLSCN